MDQNQKLNSLITELKNLTDTSLDIVATTPEEIENAIEQLQRLCSAYKEKYDKDYFLKSILFNDISVGTIDSHATNFRINPAEKRATFLLETKQTHDKTVLTIVKHMLPSRTNSFVIPVSDRQLVLLCSFSEKNIQKAI